MDTVAPDAVDAIARATALLDAGELVALPLDACYALCADALDDDATRRLILALSLSADQPLPVVIAGYDQVQNVAFGTPTAKDLADAFWPGPLTLLLRARPWIPDTVIAGGNMVAVHVPREEFTRKLAGHFGPLAIAPVRDLSLLRAHTPLHVDAGTRRGPADTWVDATGGEAKVLIDGAIGAAEVATRGRHRD